MGYYPGAIRTRHNNTRENCILNVQDGVQQKLCFISFLDIFSFYCCSISIKWIPSSILLCVFTFGICNFRHVGFHVRISTGERSAPDILGARDNFDCNAHDQYSHMEANMAETADAKCEHAQYARRNTLI